MKWKITNMFLVSLVIIIMVVVILNMVIIQSLIRSFAEKEKYLSYPDSLSYYEAQPINFTMHFTNFIILDPKSGKPTVTDKGLRNLQERGAWIQILDDNGTELYQSFKPTDAPAHYSPVQLIQVYKYSGAIGQSSVFVAEKVLGSTAYSYLIGFSDAEVAKYMFYYNPNHLVHLFQNGVFVILLADVLVVILFGYIFARKLTKPMEGVVEGIQHLSRGEYKIPHPAKGLYQEVQRNLYELGSALNANEQERREIETMREDWISNISHDIKTPLSSIRGYAELMHDPDYEFTPEEIQEYAQIILNKSAYMQSLVEDLNLSTRLRNKLVPLRKDQVNFVEMVRNVVIDMLNDPQYQDREIHFHAEAEEIPLTLDEQLFKRAITNLLYNSLVHNDRGTAITVTIVKADALQLRIEDNGKGIPPKDLKYIFNRYYRGTNTGEVHKGSGLGLAIVKEIIEAHGGTISVDSELGKGTRVTIHL